MATKMAPQSVPIPYFKFFRFVAILFFCSWPKADAHLGAKTCNTV